MSRNLFVAGVLATIIMVSTGAVARERLSTSYEAGHFFATPQTHDGKNLRLVVDTGGPGGSGLYVLRAQSVQRLMFAEAIGRDLPITVWRRGALVDVIARPVELTGQR